MKKFILLHREIAVTPFTLGMIHRGFHHRLQLKYTTPLYFKNSFIAYHNYKCDWYGDGGNFRDLGYLIVAKSEADPTYKDRLLQDTLQRGKKLYSGANKINRTDLKKLPPRRLTSILNKLYSLGSDLCDVGMVAAAPDVAFNNFSKRLQDVIKKAVTKQNAPRSANEYFNILTTSGKGSLTRQENLALLQLANKLSRSKKLIRLFKTTSAYDLLPILERQNKNLLGQITKIKNKFGWLAFGHLGPAKDAVAYFDDLKNILTEGKINHQISNLKTEPAKLKIRQAQYYKELKLTRAEKQLLATAQNFSYNKAFRYDMLLYAFYTFDKILREISRRIYLPLKDLYFLSPEEISQFLAGKKPVNKSELVARRHCCIVTIKKNGVNFISGEKAKQYQKRHAIINKIRKNLTVIHGTVAYLGRATGQVKIIGNKQEMVKVEPGDILVAAQTTPDLVPAMKRAAAFVTDIGGITSHAAIVAREMKKPCIIGTKIATKALKDGDKVEVNANEGDIIRL